jgi:hypothetical protein
MLGGLRKAAILIGLALLARPAAAADLVLDRAGFYLVTVQINGVTLRLRADPAASGLVILNPDAVRRAKIQPELVHQRPGIPGLFIREATARVGPVSLAGRTRALLARIGGEMVPVRAIWFDRAAIDGADGVISPASLPYDSVSFRLRPPRGDESDTALVLEFVTELGLYHPWLLGERAIPIQFSLWRPASISTAAAGALIARGRAGAWRGDLDRLPLSFGIVRPVRPMMLARPIELGGLSVGRFLVRTGDYRGAYALPPDAALDPDEIVVTAERAVQAARLNLILGQDQFGACASLRFERAPRRLILSCAPAGANPPRGSAPAGPRAPIADSIGRGPGPRFPPDY